jgi:hypothetical protein
LEALIRKEDLTLMRIAAPAGMRCHGQTLPIAVGMVAATSSSNGMLLVTLYSPEFGRLENYRGGASKTNAEMFGAWVPAENMSLKALSTAPSQRQL